jgi:hypothetical protein
MRGEGQLVSLGAVIVPISNTMYNLLQSVWTPEQSAAFSGVCAGIYEQFWAPLHVPDWTAWQEAFKHAAADSHQAAVSLASFFFLSLRPFVLLVYLVMHGVAHVVWKYVLVQGISQQGVQYLTTAAKIFYRHQRSLSERQVAVEVGVVSGAILMYQISKVLYRQAYFRRFTAFVSRQKNLAVRSYWGSRRAVVQVSHFCCKFPHLVVRFRRFRFFPNIARVRATARARSVRRIAGFSTKPYLTTVILNGCLYRWSSPLMTMAMV